MSQYRCPACARCSCSLACVKNHKAHYKCNGIRDKTAPVPRRSYDEHSLISDYSLLEEAKKKKDQATRNRVRNVYNPCSSNSAPDPIPRHKQRIMGREAAKRGIDLRFMPNFFYRHRVNTSLVKPVDFTKDNDDSAQKDDTGERQFDKIMVWRVDVQFSGSDGGTRLVEIHDLDEEANMEEILEKAVKSLKIRKDRRFNGSFDPYLHYSGLSGDQLNAYIKNEVSLGARRAEPTVLPDAPKYKRRKLVNGRVDLGELELDTRGFIPVNASKTLRESLNSALIVEYPILYVAPKGSKEDKEFEEATKSLFDKPEKEADDSLLPPPSRVGLEDLENRGDDDKRNIDLIDNSFADGEIESNVPTSEATAPAIENGNDVNLPAAGVTIDTGDEMEDKRISNISSSKEESDDDEESELSEPERIIEKRLPPKKTGGKTGWTRDGRIKVAGGKRPASVAFPTPRFRSVLPPLRYEREDQRKCDKNGDIVKESVSRESVESDGGSETWRREEVQGSSRQEDEDVMSEKLTAKFPGQRKRRAPKRQRFADLETIEEKNEDQATEKEKDPVSDSEGKNAANREEAVIESHPLPFLKIDAALLSTRIPRRKKMSDSSGREALAF